jgi:hypothetical protein
MILPDLVCSGRAPHHPIARRFGYGFMCIRCRLVLLLLLLLLTLCSCGISSSPSTEGPSRGVASPGTQAPTREVASPVATQTFSTPSPAGAAYAGTCPGGIGSVNDLGVPALVFGSSHAEHQGSAHPGDLVQVQLSSQERWRLVSMNGIEQQTGLLSPAGYEDSVLHACVWNFRLPVSGTVVLVFAGTGLCTNAHSCPQFVVRETFTISVQ